MPRARRRRRSAQARARRRGPGRGVARQASGRVGEAFNFASHSFHGLD